MDVHLFDAEFHADPYPAYAQLRQHAPVLQYGDTWLISRYADVAAILKNPILFSHQTFWDEPVGHYDRADARQTLVIQDSFAKIMMYTDGDPHTRMRRHSNRTFTPARVAERRSRIESLCATLLQAGRARDSFDYAQQVALQLPSLVMADYLGIPDADRAHVLEMVERFSAIFEPMAPPEREAMLIASAPLVDYLDELIAQRWAQPADDFVSHLLSVPPSGGGMSLEEVRGNLMHFLMAGNETTTNLLGHLMVLISQFPRLRAELTGDPAKQSAFIEETLRYEAPITLVARKTTTEVTLGGHTVPEGAMLGLLLGSANRDECKFSDPDVFDPARPDKAHLSFAGGPHFCIGAALARLEAAVALELLTGEFADLTVDTTTPMQFKPDLLSRGYSHLQVHTTRHATATT